MFFEIHSCVRNSFLIAVYFSTLQIHNSFIHSPADGNLSCGQFSGITTKGATSILVHFVSWACFYFSWAEDPGVELLSHRVGVHLTLQKTAKEFSKMIIPFYIPTRVKEVFFKITLWTAIKKMLNEICFIILRQYPALFQLAALQIWSWEWMMTTLRLAGWISKQESCQRFFCEGLPNAAKSSISSDPWIPKASWNSACS